jgi:sugar phosphate isomerase/epimerase
VIWGLSAKAPAPVRPALAPAGAFLFHARPRAESPSISFDRITLFILRETRYTSAMNRILRLCGGAISVLAASLFIGQQPAQAADVGTGKSFKGPIGLQLYSLRGDFTKNVPATLEKVKALGFKDVELAGTYGLSPEKFKEMLDQNGLKPISGHFAFDSYQTNLANVVKEAKALGLKYAGCAWITHNGDFTEKDCRKAIEVFNAAGAELAKNGIKFFYHTHGYEFQRFGDGTLFDLLMKETERKNVNFEMDVFWIIHPGQNPVALLEKYGNRFKLMHVKDMKKGTKTGLLTGKSDVTNDVPLGTGQIDYPAILKAAKKAGIQYYFIEDESPTSVEQIPVTLKYLENVKF